MGWLPVGTRAHHGLRMGVADKTSLRWRGPVTPPMSRLTPSVDRHVERFPPDSRKSSKCRRRASVLYADTYSYMPCPFDA